MKNSIFNRFSISLSVAGLLASGSSSAGTITWNSAGATSTSWALASNWIGGVAPVAGDDVVINGDGANDPTNNSAYTGIAIRSLTLTGGASVALSSTLQVGAGGVFNTMTVNSLNLKAVNLTTDQTWGGTRTIFVQGAITGAKMNFEGSAARFDTNSPDWASGLDVRTLVNMGGSFAPATTLTPWGTGTINLINQKTDLSNSNPVLNMSAAAGNDSLANANTLANNIVLQDPGTGNFTISQSNDSAALAGGHFFNLSGVISGTVNSARTLTFSNSKGAGTPVTFNLTNANTYNAQTKIGTNTTLGLGHVNALQNSTLDTGTSGSQNLSFTLAGSNTYNIGGLAGADDIDVGGNTISVGGNNSSNTYSAVISGSGGFTKTGSGVQTLSGNNTFGGVANVSSGALEITNAGALGNATGGTVVSSGASLRLSGGITVANEALQLSGTGVSDGGALRNVSGNNTYNGAITFSNASRINSDSGTLTLGGAASGAHNVTIGGNGNVVMNGNLGIGAGSLTKDGSGRLTLAAANSFSGGTTFSGDTLTVAASGALGSGAVTGTSSSVLTFNTSSSASFANTIALSTVANGAIINQSATSVVTLAGAVALTSGSYHTFVGTGMNNAGFVISNTVTSDSRIILKDTNLTIAAGGNLNPTFKRVSLGDSGGSGSALYLENGVNLGLKVVDAQNFDVGDAMNFTVGMKSAGTSTFGGDGGVAVDLHFRSSGGENNAWNFEAVAGATVNFTGKIVNTGTTANGTVNKTGDGTVIFSGANTYGGATTVSGGTLIVNGSLANTTTTVLSGAAIGGSGSLDGALTVNAGGTLAPGNSPGNLTLNNGLTLAGSYAWDLVTLSTANPGSNFDVITITAGNVDITGASLGLNLGANAPDSNPFWQEDQIWQGIINNTGAGDIIGAFAAIDNSMWSSLGTFSTTQVGNDVNLVWTAIPEPNIAALVGSIGVIALFRRRRV